MTVGESGGSDAGRPIVVFDAGSAMLEEGYPFILALSHTFVSGSASGPGDPIDLNRPPVDATA